MGQSSDAGSRLAGLEVRNKIVIIIAIFHFFIVVLASEPVSIVKG